MPALSPSNLGVLRLHPHNIDTYLAVLIPETAYTAVVGSWDDDKINITCTTTAGAVADCLAGMSVYIGPSSGLYGSQAKGRVRLVSVTDIGGGSVTIKLAANSINWQVDDKITIKKTFEYWTVYPRAVYDDEGDVLTMYKDWDITYTDQNIKHNPTPVMGPPACAFIDSVTGLATIYFDGQDSYCIGEGIASWVWEFEGGTPAGISAATPGNVTWDTPGTWLVKLTVTAVATGKQTIGYRYVYIFRKDDAMPYTDFIVHSAGGSVSDGGWSWDIEVFGEADRVGDFPEGTQVVLFAETNYGVEEKNFGMNHTGRQNIRGVGWIQNESIVVDEGQGSVRFQVAGISDLMKMRENFSVLIEFTKSLPSDWNEVYWLDTERALFHYMYWHSTIYNVTDVRFPSVLHEDDWGPFEVPAQEFVRGSVWDGIQKLCEDAFLTPVADRTSSLFIDYNPHMLPRAATYGIDFRGNMPVVMVLTHADREGVLDLQRRTEHETSYVDFQGVAYDGATKDPIDAEPVLSCAPGKQPLYSGRPKPSLSHILDSTSWQARSNELAGHQLAWDNLEYEPFQWPCMGDYSVSDIAPREIFILSLDAEDTKRGIVWSAQRLLVSALEEIYDSVTGTVQTVFTFEVDTEGVDGETGEYPPDQPTPPPPEPPDPPPPPEPPIPPAAGTGKNVLAAFYIQIDGAPLMRVVRCSNIAAASPIWEFIDGGGFAGDCACFDPLKLDPWDDTHRAFLAAGRNLYMCNDYTAPAPTWKLIYSCDDMFYPSTAYELTAYQLSIEFENYAVIAVHNTVGWPVDRGYLTSTFDFTEEDGGGNPDVDWLTPQGLEMSEFEYKYSVRVMHMDCDERPYVDDEYSIPGRTQPVLYLGMQNSWQSEVHRMSTRDGSDVWEACCGGIINAADGCAAPMVPYEKEKSDGWYWIRYEPFLSGALGTQLVKIVPGDAQYNIGPIGSPLGVGNSIYASVQTWNLDWIVYIAHGDFVGYDKVWLSKDGTEISPTWSLKESTPSEMTILAQSLFPYNTYLAYGVKKYELWPDQSNWVMYAVDELDTWFDKSGNLPTLFDFTHVADTVRGRGIVPTWTGDE